VLLIPHSINKGMDNFHSSDEDTTIRGDPVCRGCGLEKDVGCIVCWTCFKYVEDPFKYSDVSFQEWLRTRSPKARK
jgi:hypothetical protein